MTERLKCDDKVVGLKQVIRAINTSSVHTVFVSKDADENIITDVLKDCEGKDIQIEYVQNMNELGKACGIDINAAVAALLE